MNKRGDRLDRLAAAQSKLADLIQMKLVRHELRAASLQQLVAQLTASTSTMEESLMPFRAGALMKLAEAQAMLNTTLKEGDAIRHDLVAAQERDDALSKLARQFHASAERKAFEEDSLENAIQLAAKASGKAGMLK